MCSKSFMVNIRTGASNLYWPDFMCSKSTIVNFRSRHEISKNVNTRTISVDVAMVSLLTLGIFHT